MTATSPPPCGACGSKCKKRGTTQTKKAARRRPFNRSSENYFSDFLPEGRLGFFSAAGVAFSFFAAAFLGFAAAFLEGFGFSSSAAASLGSSFFAFAFGAALATGDRESVV